MKFSGVAKSTGFLPGRVVELLPAAWSETWGDRPRETTRVGLRVIPDAAKDAARVEAARKAVAEFPGRDDDDPLFVEAYNAALMRGAVAVSLCHAEDTSRDAFEMQPTIVDLAMTTPTVAMLYDELELLEIVQSPASALASDEQIVAIVEACKAGKLDALVGGDARFVRRLLFAAAERLGVEAV